MCPGSHRVKRAPLSSWHRPPPQPARTALTAGPGLPPRPPSQALCASDHACPSCLQRLCLLQGPQASTLTAGSRAPPISLKQPCVSAPAGRAGLAGLTVAAQELPSCPCLCRPGHLGCWWQREAAAALATGTGLGAPRWGSPYPGGPQQQGQASVILLEAVLTPAAALDGFQVPVDLAFSWTKSFNTETSREGAPEVLPRYWLLNSNSYGV